LTAGKILNHLEKLKNKNGPYFDGRIKMNVPYPEITNISFLVKLFFKTFISLKYLSKGGASERCDFSQFGKRQFSYGIYN
jgi:hypothetical protein